MPYHDVYYCFIFLKLTPEEKMKQRERKEQNRRAAMRCRERKKEELKSLLKVCIKNESIIISHNRNVYILDIVLRENSMHSHNG